MRRSLPCRITASAPAGLWSMLTACSAADRYGIDPVAEGLPDVLAPSADGYQAQAKWSPFHGGLLRPDPNLPATHWRDGIVAIDAPDIRPGDRMRADLHDLAPTTL